MNKKKAGKPKKKKVKVKKDGAEKKINNGAMTICKKLGSICKRNKMGIDRKKREAFIKLGAELWCLYQNKVYDAVFEQEKVKEVIKEMKGYEREEQKKEAERAARKKMEEDRIMMRNAAADLKNKDPRVRRAAIRIIDKLGDADAVRYLTGMVDDPDAAVRNQASEVIHKFVNRYGESVSGDKGKHRKNQQNKKTARKTRSK